MTREEQLQAVREKIENILGSPEVWIKIKNTYGDITIEEFNLNYTETAKRILSIPNLAIIDPDAELPENPYKVSWNNEIESANSRGFYKGQQSLISQGWRKTI
jgi:hypothetical protein